MAEVKRTAPYMGLVPFTEGDAEFFFGREREREIITANLKVSRLTIVYGSSGVGKSSVLRAGVVHHCVQESRENQDEEDFVKPVAVYFSSWRDNVKSALLQRVREAVCESRGRRAVEPPELKGSLTEALEQWTALLGTKLLIIMDQFEEYFVYHGEEGNGGFVAELAEAVNATALKAHFLISMREDAVAKLDVFKELIPNLFQNYLRIHHLDWNAAREAIEKPVEHYNDLVGEPERVRLEPALTEEILAQVTEGQVHVGVGGKGRLPVEAKEKSGAAIVETPYLQLVLTRLWDSEMAEGSRTLRLKTLNETLGGAKTIVKTHLSTAMDRMSAEERGTAAKIFKYLVTPGGTKIAYAVRDLAEYTSLPESAIAPLVEKLASPDVRVLRKVEPPLDRPELPRYEIFHDVLAQAILGWRQWLERSELEAKAEREAKRADRQARIAAMRRRQNALLKILLGVALVAIVLVVFLGWETLQTNRINYVRSLISTVHRNLSLDPELGTILGIRAVEAARELRGRPARLQDEAAAALERAVQESRIERVLPNATAAVTAVAFSRQGRLVASGDQRGAIEISPLAAGQKPFSLKGHAQGISSLAFSKYGNFLASADASGKVAVWSCATWKPLFALAVRAKGGGSCRASFSPDETLLAVVDAKGSLTLYNIRSGEAVATIREAKGAGSRFVIDAAFSPDGNAIAAAYRDENVKVWRLTSQAGSATVSAHPVRQFQSGHKDRITRIVYDPDGRWIATAGMDYKIKIHNATEPGEPKTLQGHSNAVFCIDFCPQGDVLASASADQTVKLWNPVTGQTLATLSGHDGPVTAVAFNPGGERQVVTGGWDKTVRMWDAAIGHQAGIADLASDGSAIVTAGKDRTARIWDFASGRELFTIPHNEDVTVAASAPAGNLVASGSLDGVVQLWDLKTLAPRHVFKDENSPVRAMAFNGDGKKIAIGHRNCLVGVWNTATLERDFVSYCEHPLTSVAFNPAGTLLAAATEGGEVKIYDLVSKRALSTPSEKQVNALAFSPDGRMLAAGGDDNQVRIIDPRTGKELQKLQLPQQVRCVSFSHDGRRLAAAGWDNKAMVWDTGSWQGHELSGHIAPINRIVFSNDDKLIATASWDRTAKVWEAATGNLLVSRGHRSEVTGVAFNRAATVLATSSEDKTMRLHPLDVKVLLRQARSRVTRPLREEERERYLQKDTLIQKLQQL